MNLSRPSRVLISCVATAAVLAAGCSSGQGKDASAEASAPGLVTDGAPTRDLMNLLGPALDASEARLNSAVNDCLVQAGLPPVPDLANLAPTPIAAFGVTTAFGVMPDGNDAGTVAIADEPPADLTPEQLAAIAGDPALEDDQAQGWGGGCFGEAAQAVYGDAGPYLELEAALDTLEEQVASDPRSAEALAEWRACMAEQGVDADTPETLAAGFTARATRELYIEDQPVEGTAPDGTTEAVSAGRLAPGLDTSVVKALQTEETRLASLADDCRSSAIDPVEQTVRAEQEAKFVTEHAELFRNLDLERFL
ncbi:MAG: hypothetical protein ACRDV9_04410 [Acidimicrobiia bacterium]